MSPAVIMTVALAGLFMSVAINLLIVLGKNAYDDVAVGSTMGLVAFSLMLVVAAFECRDEKASILRQETFDNDTLNLTALVEIVLAILIAKGAFLPSLLGTSSLSGGKWLIGAAPALALFIVWELGKAIARRRENSAAKATLRATAMPVEPAGAV
jgi:Ca2+-transporting ATPase